MLLDKSADISPTTDDGWTALHCAAISNNEAILKAVLDAIKKQSYNLNPILPNGLTPLLLALNSKASSAIIEQLIDAGSDITAKSDDNRSALCFAINRNLEKAVQILLAKGADLSVADNDGWTASSLCCC